MGLREILRFRGSRGGELDCRAGIEGCRAWTFATSTVGTTLIWADRWNLLASGGGRAAAAALEDRHGARRMEMVVRQGLGDGTVSLFEGHASTGE